MATNPTSLSTTLQAPTASTVTTTITTSTTGNTSVTTVTTVATPVGPVEPVIPSTALTTNMLLSKAWSCKHDLGTPGDANGTWAYPTTAPDKTANCALLAFNNINKGGALYHANVMADATPYNTFCLEVVEYFPVAPTGLSCMENDLEQVQAAVAPATNAAYVDMATQLDHYNGTVDITQNQKWIPTSVKIYPSSRKAGVWYTTRIYVKNNGGGSVTYIGIYLSDLGVYSQLNTTVQSQPGELWGQKLLNQQKQFVGLNMGTLASQVYVKTLNIHSWKS
jgi:hypothetical protein